MWDGGLGNDSYCLRVIFRADGGSLWHPIKDALRPASPAKPGPSLLSAHEDDAPARTCTRKQLCASRRPAYLVGSVSYGIQLRLRVHTLFPSISFSLLWVSSPPCCCEASTRLTQETVVSGRPPMPVMAVRPNPVNYGSSRCKRFLSCLQRPAVLWWEGKRHRGRGEGRVIKRVWGFFEQWRLYFFSALSKNIFLGFCFSFRMKLFAKMWNRFVTLF